MKISKSLIGILGGSFDPPHQGHLKISNISINRLKIKKLYWIITKKNPLKKKPHFSLKERISKSKNIIGYIDDIGYFGNTSRYKVRLDNDQIIDVTAQNQKRPKDEKDRLTYEDKVNLSWDNSSAMLLLK